VHFFNAVNLFSFITQVKLAGEYLAHQVFYDTTD